MAPEYYSATYQGETIRSRYPIGKGLLCPICRSLLASPRIAVCGHAFCSSCVNKWLTSNTQCPMCDSDISNAKPTKSKLLSEIISSTELVCAGPPAADGSSCTALLTVDTKDAHAETCPYILNPPTPPPVRLAPAGIRMGSKKSPTTQTKKQRETKSSDGKVQQPSAAEQALEASRKITRRRIEEMKRSQNIPVSNVLGIKLDM